MKRQRSRRRNQFPVFVLQLLPSRACKIGKQKINNLEAEIQEAEILEAMSILGICL